MGRYTFTGGVTGLLFLLPFYVFAQMTGGGYTVNGQANPITGVSAGGGYTAESGGNPSHGIMQGGGYSINAGTYFSNLPIVVLRSPSVSTGVVTGGGGIYNASTTPITYSSSTMPLCSTATLYVPKTPIKLGRTTNNSFDVRKLQQFLNAFEGFHLVVDGVYKQADFKAVIVFQERHKKEILLPWNLTKGTGYISVTSLGYLNSLVLKECTQTPFAKNPRCPYFVITHTLGDTGSDVQRVQLFLVNIMHTSSSTVSGTYTSVTRSTVKQFQSTYAKEILTPLGLTAPSGLWYTSTIKKANQLFGCN